MRDLRVAARQVRYEQLSFFRNPAAAGFTFIFPVIFLVIFGALYGDQTYEGPSGPVRGIQYLMAQILVFSVVGSTYVSLVTTLALRRDSGELKRKRGTPVPPAVVLGGVVGNGVLLSLLMTVLVVGLAVVLFGASVPLERIPVLLVTLIIGALTFCALGAAVAGVVPNGDAAPAFANITIFPLYFLSGVFIPDIPSTVEQIADLFPLRPFLVALSKVFDPGAAAGLDWASLLPVAIWGVAGLLIALRTFRWMPRR